MRERVAVVETLLLTVIRSEEKLAATVETLSERADQERGQNPVTPIDTMYPRRAGENAPKWGRVAGHHA
jgi:hypothetical protein